MSHHLFPFFFFFYFVLYRNIRVFHSPTGQDDGVSHGKRKPLSLALNYRTLLRATFTCSQLSNTSWPTLLPIFEPHFTRKIPSMAANLQLHISIPISFQPNTPGKKNYGNDGSRNRSAFMFSKHCRFHLSCQTVNLIHRPLELLRICLNKEEKNTCKLQMLC